MDSQQMENTSATSPAIAVIILNWNGEKLLREYLPQVVATTDGSLSRVIVADNGSSDGSLEYLRGKECPSVEVMEFDKNYGFAEGYNKAIEAVGDKYEYVVLLNSDVATSEDWDRALYNYMESHPCCGGCQPKLLSYLNKDYFEYAGAAGGFIDRNGYPYCRGRIFGTCERDNGQYDSAIEVHWATGACLMVRRKVYLDAGGLDAGFFAHMEEIDLCWRIRLLGFSLAAVPESKVYHLGGGSLPADNPRKTYLNFRNNLLMLHKNLPDNIRGGFLFRRRLLDTVAWIKFVLSFDFANAGAVWRAHRDFAKMCKQYTFHPQENLIGKDDASRVNILTSYYLKGRKTFTEILK